MRKGRNKTGTSVDKMYEVLPASCGSHSGSEKVASAPARNLLEMQIPEPHPRPSESETLGVGPNELCFTCPPGAPGLALRLENPCPSTCAQVPAAALGPRRGRGEHE